VKGFPDQSGDLLHDQSTLGTLAKAVDAAMTRRARVAAEPSASTSAKLKATPVDEVPAGFLPADTILRSWPAGLSPSAARRGQQASDRLRADRRLDLAMHVEVVTDHGLVSFEPLKVGQNPLEARFTFRRAGRVVDAALRLKTPSGPLALRLAAHCPDQLVGEAWAAAVAVYAELTCVEPAPVQTADPSRRRLQRAGISQGHTSPAQHRALATARPSPRPVTLVVASLARAHEALRAVGVRHRRFHDQRQNKQGA
jgi:hypothetical protein